MKILLIHPNKFAHRYASVGISMISGVLKKAGHEVDFFDTSRFKEEEDSMDHSEKSVQKMEQILQFLPVSLPMIKKSDESIMAALHFRIRAFDPGLIAFSATSSEFSCLVTIVQEIKKYRIPIVVGGIHATVSPLEALAVDGIDMVVIGEGEEAILELAEAMESGIPRTDINNIYFKENNRIIRNPVRPYIKDLDSLPFMDLDIFDRYHHLGAYQGRIVKYARVETGRGCPYECSYCVNKTLHDSIYSHEKRHIRKKSPKRVIEELEFIHTKIDFDIVRFVDETFTSCSIKWLEEFVSEYKSRIKKPMIITTRPEAVTLEKMKVIREADKDIQVTMGIETGSERIRRDILNRKMSNRRIREAYHLCDELGFSTAAFNMIGIPGETREDFFETIEVNIEAKVQIPILTYFYPFAGCRLREICLREGYMADECHEVDYSISSLLKLPNFPIEEIEGLKRTFVMYVKMDKSFYPEIKSAESDGATFNKLAEIYRSKESKNG